MPHQSVTFNLDLLTPKPNQATLANRSTSGKSLRQITMCSTYCKNNVTTVG